MAKIGFIGAGQMATALAKGFVAAGKVQGHEIVASDPSQTALTQFTSEIEGSESVDDAVKCVTKSESVFLCVKPQHMEAVFRGLNGVTNQCLFVSIAAGVPLATLKDGLKTDRIIRVMPNTPCLVGQGAAGFCLAEGATTKDGNLVGDLLNAVGVAFQLPENQLDAVTGLSGSGPAFVYQMIEAMSDGGVRVGLPRSIATKLAAQTVLGAAWMVLETGEHPGVLKDRVASPGGTTIAGLHSLETSGIRGAFMDAVKTAADRSRELGSNS